MLVRYGDLPARELIDPLFSHLRSTDGAKSEVAVDVLRAGESYCFGRNGQVLYGDISIELLSATAQAVMLIEVQQRSSPWIGIHAAALVVDDLAIILAGNNGAGKSTLTAALINDGFHYLADDVTLLVDSGRRIVSTPACITVKSGSWEPLREFYPQLASLPVHTRADGKKVRFLPPPSTAFCAPVSQPLRHALVFLRYSPSAAPSLTAVSKAAAFERLAADGLTSSAGITRDAIAQSLEWLARVDCYEMNYSTFDDAASMLRDI